MVSFTDFKILDEARIQEIGAELMGVVGKVPSKRLVVNFTGVTFMSSAMVGKIILLNNKCKEATVDLRLCEIAENIKQVFKLMRLDKILKIYPTEEKAIESFDKKGWFG